MQSTGVARRPELCSPPQNMPGVLSMCMVLLSVGLPLGTLMCVVSSTPLHLPFGPHPLAPFNFKTHDLSGTMACIFWLLEIGLHNNTKHTLHSSIINFNILRNQECMQSVLTTLRMQLQPGTCPFSVLGFWGNMTMPSAGIMTYRRDFPSTTRI